MKRTNLPHTSWLLSFLFCSLIHAQSPAPKLIPFQGRLTDHLGNVVTNGARLVMFQMFDSPVSGKIVWPGELHRTTVNGGLVNVQLGTGTPLDRVDFDQPLYLQITLDLNGDGQLNEADPPMLPRQAILPAVFAKEAADSRTLAGFDWRPIFGVNSPAGKIDGAKIGNITSNSITAGTINASLIAPLTITSNQIAQKNIGAAQIADGAIQNVHLAPGIVSINNLVPRRIVSTTPLTPASIGDVGRSPILANLSTSSTVYVDVPELVVQAQVTGRPVIVQLVPGVPDLDSQVSGRYVTYIRLLRITGGTTNIAGTSLASTEVGSFIIPPSAFAFVDQPTKGLVTYKIQVKVANYSSSLVNVRLMVYEL